jgi:hypothetical protein
MAQVALSKRDSGDAFYDTKLHLARFYMQRVLPQTASLDLTLRSGSAPVMALAEAAF